MFNFGIKTVTLEAEKNMVEEGLFAPKYDIREAWREAKGCICEEQCGSCGGSQWAPSFYPYGCPHDVQTFSDPTVQACSLQTPVPFCLGLADGPRGGCTLPGLT